MQRLLARHFGLVKMFGIGLAVFFAGSAVSHFAISSLLLDVEAIAADANGDEDEDGAKGEGEDEDERAAPRANPMTTVTANTASRKRASAETIVDGNVFCPSCLPTTEQPLGPEDSPLLATGETPSKLPLQLLATMESDDPMWSMATIRDLDNNALGPFSTNDQVRPGVTILSVERGRVVLLNQGRREYIAMGVEPPPPVAKPAAPAKPSTSKAKAGKSVEIDGASQAINCSSENACTVDRAFVNKLIKNPTQLMTQARMYPVTRDGQPGGFRVARVKKGSLATMIGLKNGDVISEINGSKLSGIDEALGLYQKLRRASHLSVVVERGGAVITKEISIK